MKRRLPVIFLFVMLFSLFAFQSAFAEDGDIASGGYADWTYRITAEGELIIGPEAAGETQYLQMPADHRTPYEEYSDQIKTASFNGNVIGQDIGGLFRECTNLTSIDFTGLDTSQATNMAAMFLDCSSLTTLDLSSFDTRKVNC